MNISRKKKSDIIFWIVFGLIVAFLYLTPWGSNTRTWIGGLFLSSPNMVSSELKNTDEQFVSTDWNLKNLEGEEVWLSETNKPIFLNIWATWCGPCRSEIPSIDQLYNKYKNEVTFILVSPDESIEKIHEFAQQNGYELPFYNANSYTPKELQTNSYPTTFILDKDKNITHKLTGAHDWNSEDVHLILDGLINK